MVTVGVQPQMTDRTMPVLDAARIAEAHGFESFFVCEHTHIPVDGASVSPRGTLPDWVKRIWDPFIALAQVAATTDLEIGTAVALVAEHDPIALAKTIASLDAMSGGRLVLGVGWGWHREEFEDHTGIPANQRVPVLREKLDLMRALWTDDEAEYHGRFVELPRSWSWPKPTQTGGPPVLLGAPANPRNFDRIAGWADGWLPMGPPPLSDEFPTQLAALHHVWEDAGRTGRPDVTLTAGPETPDDLRRLIERAHELGLRRILVVVDEAGMAHYEPTLARLAPALEGR